MVWVTFLISAALIVFAATQLAKYGDVIAIRTRLGGMFVGVCASRGHFFARGADHDQLTFSRRTQPGSGQPVWQQPVQHVLAGDPRFAPP